MDHHHSHRPRTHTISAPKPTTATGVKYKQPPELPLPPPPIPPPPPVGLTSPPLPAIPPSSPSPVASPVPGPSNSNPNARPKKPYNFAPVLPPLPPIDGSPLGFGEGGFGNGLPRRPSGASVIAHQRRPSRAERYEALVEGARELVRRDNGAELGSSNGFGKRREQEMEVIGSDDWKHSVMDLLKVVDGMARQLATHDELAAQLKIAQSNLTLAETHTDYLEETLRRRGSMATTIGRRLSNSSTLTGLGVAGPQAPDGLHHTNSDSAASKLSGFFRPKLARKNTTGAASAPNPTGRSHSVLPHVGAPGSPEPRTSSSSSEVPEWTQLEARNASLEAANAALRHEREELAVKCAGLEKTKDDLLVELEGVTAELFQEANVMVAEERKKVARFQEEAEALRAEVARLHEELAALKAAQASNSAEDSVQTPIVIQTSPRNVRNLTISPTPPSPPSSPPKQPVPASSSSSMLRSNSLDPASAARLPLTVDTSSGLSLPSPTSPQPPASPAESTTSTTRKWFNFGRGGSAISPAASEAGEEARLDAPAMDRGDSVQSNATTSSLASIASSLFGGGADKTAKADAAADSEETEGARPLSMGEPAGEPSPPQPAAEDAESERIPTPPTAVPDTHKTRFPRTRTRSRSRSPPPRSPGAREPPPPVPFLPPTSPDENSPSPPPPAPPPQRPFQPRTFSLGNSTSSPRAYPPLPPSPAMANSPSPLSPPPPGRGPIYSSPLPVYSLDRADSSSSHSSSVTQAVSPPAGARNSPRLVVQMPQPAMGTSPRLAGSQPPTPGLGVPPSPLSGPGSRPSSRAGSVKAMDDLDSLMDSIQGMTDDLFGGDEGEDETEELQLPDDGARGLGVRSGHGGLDVENGQAGAGSGPNSSVGHSEGTSAEATDTEGDEGEDEDLEGAEVVVGTRAVEATARRGSAESTGTGLAYDEE